MDKVFSTGRLITGLLLVLLMSSYWNPGEEDRKERKPRSLAPAAYVRWVEGRQSGLTVSQTEGTLDFRLLYRPSDYILLKENMPDKKNLTKKAWKAKKEKMEGVEYYTFSIALNDGRKDLLKSLTHGAEEYEKLLLYFAGQMQQDLRVAAGKDTVKCSLYHFERTYGITSDARFVLGFESPASPEGRKEGRALLFDAWIFGKGIIKLQLKKEDIHTIPRLNLKD